MLIEGLFTTITPLSHISQNISTGSLLNELPIIQDDETSIDVFCYNGNAWRGQLRDLCALYLIEKTGVESLKPAMHNFLFSGGKIGGQSKFDLKNIRRHTELLPHFDMFGGCLNNMMYAGNMAVFDSLPLCFEAVPSLPESQHETALARTYKNMTIDREFTRMDDSKNKRLNKTIEESEDKETIQMRVSGEYLNSNVDLFTRIFVKPETIGLEIGALCSSLYMFSKAPFIGGQHNKGHGLVDLTYTIAGKVFFSVKDMNEATMSDDFLEYLNLYNNHLADRKDDIIALLES